MKFLIATFVLAASCFAGPLKVASYPVRHPVKTTKGVGTGIGAASKGLFVAVKAVIW